MTIETVLVGELAVPVTRYEDGIVYADLEKVPTRLTLLEGFPIGIVNSSGEVVGRTLLGVDVRLEAGDIFHLQVPISEEGA